MKIKRILAMAAVAAMAVSTFAMSASAAELKGDVCNKTSFKITSEDFTATDAPKITVEGLVNLDDTTAPQWNDYCTGKIKVVSDGVTTYYAFIGAAVNWDTTVDDNGTPDDKDDDTIIKAADCTIVDGDYKATFDLKLGKEWSVEVVALGWGDSEETAVVPYISAEATGFTAGGTPSTDAPATEDTKVPVTGNAGVAGLVVVAALATAGIVISKRK